ncbi:LysR family transcriptional regulator [Thalassospira marina]|uniref:LysR family transcriptional regulator n=1 Tax=Thalassospira marina TaxID=2048283 RepID=A0A2N3KTE5_9PROT|nr:LysR family transcriptional regulator [Thalassospira marina]PKR53825.1 LysR family transcriptional regulator [Thalassospira marina]
MNENEIDLNLLRALDVLLSECSVTTAAKHLGLSVSAMSRTLTRLRAVTGDPLLVRAGRGLVPTPRAAEIRDQVHELMRDVRTVLTPHLTRIDPASLKQTFIIRASEAFLEFLAARVVNDIAAAAPDICLQFVAKPDKDAQPLRDGAIDLEIGVLGTNAPEVRTRLLFHDKFVGIARKGHPFLNAQQRDGISVSDFACQRHVVVSKQADGRDMIDAKLDEAGLARQVRVIVPGFPDALRIVRQSDLVGVIPRSCFGTRLVEFHPGLVDIQSFDLPFDLPEFPVLAMWHPRMQADPAHQWMRNRVIEICRQAYYQHGAAGEDG